MYFVGTSTQGPGRCDVESQPETAVDVVSGESRNVSSVTDLYNLDSLISWKTIIRGRITRSRCVDTGYQIGLDDRNGMAAGPGW